AVSEKAVNEALVVQQARIGPRHWSDVPPRVLVTGQGPIAFTAVLASVARGWPVTMTGRDQPSTFRAQLAQRFGARYVPMHDLLGSLDADHALLADVERDGFDLVLECTGGDDVMIGASAVLASRGVMVWLGSTRVPERTQRPVQRMMRDGILRNHLHVAVVNSAPRDFVDALAHLDQLLPTHGRELADLMTARVAPVDALWHYEHRQGQGIKTVVDYTS
ncbi:MAG TPA: hypothetical protein PLV92_28545, partial [Pirellulaceae bacterium]|nr:hypothetical protein [Pirellulaceae bacterium]